MLSYQDVYDAAKSLDADRLPLTQWVDYLDNAWTPASQLAYEGESEAVAFLLSRGADPKMIAEGYARAGNHVMVEQYRRKYPDCVNAIARGYAWAGDHERVERYRSQYHAWPECIAAGYVMAGDHVNVEMYRLQHGVTPSQIGCIYAQVNDPVHVAMYEELGASPEMVAAGYVLAKQEDRVAEYVETYHVKAFTLVPNYILIGDHAKVATCCEKNPALVEWAVKYYAKVNNYEQLALYQQKYHVDLDVVMEGHAMGGHHRQVIDIVMQKIIHEIQGLKTSWFYDHSEQIKSLQALHRNLIAPSARDKTLGDLLRRLGMPMDVVTARSPIFLQTILLHPSQPVQVDQNKYKTTLRQERAKEESDATSSESDESSVEYEQRPQRTGLRYRGGVND